MKRIFLNIILILFSLSVFAQNEEKDSLVRLISADKARLLQINGQSFRKVEGNALFLHNNTYLKCDNALWNVDKGVIDAVGNVQVIQEKTVLTGDSLKYLIDEDLARFRGHIVQLVDKDSNMLRTRFLDYNTKDSIAHFQRGGAMMDKDGSLIESQVGHYYAKSDLFVFKERVEMFSDSLFFVTDSLKYFSQKDIIEFDGKTNGWYDKYAIASGGGWYNRNNETFFFDRSVHVISDENEGWSETLFYDRNQEYTRMERRVEVVDTVNKSIVLGGKLDFWNEPRRAEVYQDPVIIMLQEQDGGGVDSVFIAADQFKYFQRRMFEVDSAFVAQAEQRYKSAQIDPLASKRPPEQPVQNESADSVASAPTDSSSVELQQDVQRDSVSVESPNRERRDSVSQMSGRVGRRDVAAVADSLSERGDVGRPSRGEVVSDESLRERESSDTLSTPVQRGVVRDDFGTEGLLPAGDSLSLSRVDSVSRVDSLGVADSLAVETEPLDTTIVTFVEAFKNVKIYKSDIQIKCDSLLYCSIDSMARLFTDPVIWYDGVNQITADSMQFVMEDGEMRKGYMLSKAFVISEDANGGYYHQIKSPEMIGYFRDSDLYRFDAIGGASMMVYIAEDSVVTTMNQKECRMMTAVLKDGAVERMRYYEGIKSDAFPVYDLTDEQKYLKDFNWRIEEKFNSRFDITDKKLRTSLRARVIPARNFPRFVQTNIYYPGYMKRIMSEIERRKPLIWIRK
jgi:lipopolysaccharide export system protein LptA